MLTTISCAQKRSTRPVLYEMLKQADGQCRIHFTVRFWLQNLSKLVFEAEEKNEINQMELKQQHSVAKLMWTIR